MSRQKNAVATRDEVREPEIITGAAGGGVQIRSIDDLKWFCEQLAESKMIPQHFQKHPADILVAVQWGFEIGVSPMQALSNIAVINGTASIWGDLLLALLYSKPHIIEWVEEDDLKDVVEKMEATCVIKRRGNPKPTKITYTLQMAQAAGLVEKDTYQQHLPRMLQMRARAFCARNAAPDILKGLAVHEEHSFEPNPQTTTVRAEPIRDPQPKRVEHQPAQPQHEVVKHDPPPVEVVDQQTGEIIEQQQHDDASRTSLFKGDEPKPAAVPAHEQQPASAYVAPIPPTKPTEACTREVTIAGRKIYTAGASNITMMKLLARVEKFDAAYKPGTAFAAIADCFGADAPVDWYHFTEEQARAFVDFLAANE